MAIEYLGKRLLFLDPSSTCTGYCVTMFDKDKQEAIIMDCGVFWFEKDIPQGLKYYKVSEFVCDLCELYRIEAVISERYFLNPYNLAGQAICPELQGSLQSWLYTLVSIPSWSTIPPSQWRAACKIKKDPTKAGSSKWKIPTKKKIEEILNYKFPEKIISNVTEKKRNMPFDLFDAVGIAIGFLTLSPNNCKKFKIEKDIFKEE